MSTPKVRLEWILVADLVLMRTGNRRVVNRARIRKMAREFDPDKFGELRVTEKNGAGKHEIIDGQHRWLMVTEELGWKDQRLPCVVDPNATTPAEKAKRFRGLNYRIAVRPVDDFKQAVVEGVEWAVKIEAILRRHGFRVDYTTSDSSISAVNALKVIYDGTGETGLTSVLTTAVAAWGKTAAAVPGDVLRGLGLFFRRYARESIDRASLVAKLRKLPGGPSHALIGRARAGKEIHGSTVPHNIAAIIVVVYNKGRRTQQLPDWWGK